jgi:hypothetical protein
MKLKISLTLLLCAVLFGSCNDALDRPSITTPEDDGYWTNEEKVKLYANGFYSYFFVGYGNGWDPYYLPNENYVFNDDAVRLSQQTAFTRVVPTSLGSTSTALSASWQSQYTGPSWNFAWIRKANIMIDRITQVMPNILSDTSYKHWLGIGRFFRALEYARLVNVFGDVPYYDHEVKNTDLADLYKDRTPRNEVMDAVYDDFEYAIENVKTDDGGAAYVNRYVVAALVARWSLFEGSWQKYYYKNNERAQKFFELAVKAAEVVMSNTKYAIATDFNTLFGSTDLRSASDVIFYRVYNKEQSITHHVASYCNMTEVRDVAPNLSLVKAFICNDGKDYQTSTVSGAKDFTMENLIKTRDPRFEASFYEKATPKSKSSYIYLTKFIPHSALNYLKTGGTPALEFTSTNNVTGYPVLRFAEVLLSWIEAKAELATLGGTAVTQADIDLSINKIRNRPLSADAIAKGVKKTAPMQLSNLPNDPARDADVSPLLWEIRRERRMEFAFEASRIIDLRRWKKLEYMDTAAHQDLLMGIWVNFPQDAPDQLTAANVGKIRVVNNSGKLITYDGTNKAQMIGFFYPTQNEPRLPFLDIPNVNPYLCPIGTNQMTDYANRGYKLTQTEGWPSTVN